MILIASSVKDDPSEAKILSASASSPSHSPGCLEGILGDSGRVTGDREVDAKSYQLIKSADRSRQQNAIGGGRPILPHESDPTVDSRDPPFVNLKCLLLQRMLEIEQDTAERGASIHLVESPEAEPTEPFIISRRTAGQSRVSPSVIRWRFSGGRSVPELRSLSDQTPAPA